MSRTLLASSIIRRLASILTFKSSTKPWLPGQEMKLRSSNHLNEMLTQPIVIFMHLSLIEWKGWKLFAHFALGSGGWPPLWLWPIEA
jgi:hypothetical protein